MHQRITLVLVLLLEKQNAEVPKIPSVKHVMSCHVKNYLRAFITWHDAILVQLQWELALP